MVGSLRVAAPGTTGLHATQAHAFSPYVLVPNILQYTFNNLYLSYAVAVILWNTSCKEINSSGFELTLRETRWIHDLMNGPKIVYIYILYFQLSFKFSFIANLAGFPDNLNYINRNGGLGTVNAPNLHAYCHLGIKSLFSLFILMYFNIVQPLV